VVVLTARTPSRVTARRVRVLLALMLLWAPARDARAAPRDDVRVATRAALLAALRSAEPGTTIRVAPGTYEGGLYVEDLRGTAERPVTVVAEESGDPPRFRGGTTGLHLVRPAHVRIDGLHFEGATANGVNVDDGGGTSPARGVTLANLVVQDVGARGNEDGIKLSGLEDFAVSACTVLRWGAKGSGVDMVGCRRGRIEGCHLRHRDGEGGGSGVQAKGGTRDVLIRRNRFEHAGARAVNAGGSTGLGYFRPPLEAWSGPRFEAKDLVVEGNTFVGGQAAVAFVGVDGAVFRFNTVVGPRRWAIRILQETTAEGFVPSRGGVVTDNLFVFDSSWASGGVNVGPHTDPESFRFERNVWHCRDAPSRTRDLVRLPTTEKDAVYGADPRFADDAGDDLRPHPDSRAARAGAFALPD
jgi:hypothetical protein